MEKETIALTDITVDLRLNIRESLDDETIKRYTENFEQLPPAVVFESDDTYLLADGFHRYEAANKLGRDEIEVEVRHGTRQDAEEYAALANLKHGKPLTRKERRKAVERMLMLHSERANAWIAEDTGVSKNTVAKYREELESKCQIDRCSTFRTKDGREFPREIKQPSKDEQVSDEEPTPTKVPPIEDEQPEAEEPQFYCDERFVSLDDIQEYVGQIVEVTVSVGRRGSNVIKRGTILEIIEEDGAFMLSFETEDGDKRQFPTGTTTDEPTDEGIIEIRTIDQPAQVVAHNEVASSISEEEEAPKEEVRDENDTSTNSEAWKTFSEYYDWIRDYALSLASQGNIQSFSEICTRLETLVKQLEKERAEVAANLAA